MRARQPRALAEPGTPRGRLLVHGSMARRLDGKT